MTCRHEVLAAFERLERRHGRTDFDLADVLQEVQANGEHVQGIDRSNPCDLTHVR